MSEHRVQYQRLDLYKKYPHLNEDEVDTYHGLMLGRTGDPAAAIANEREGNCRA